MKLFTPFALACALTLSLVHAASRAPSPAPAVPADKDRSPSGLALSADGRWAVTANRASDSVSLADVANGKVAAEVPVGREPFAIALSRDGGRAVVTNWLGDSITVLEVKPPALRVVRSVPVGDEPRGVALSADGSQAFVALAGENAVVAVDVVAGKILRRLRVGSEPWHVALTPDGKRLAVGNARSMDMTVIAVGDWQEAHTVKLRGRNVRHIAISAEGAWAYVPHISERGRPATKQNIDEGWIAASRLSRASLLEEGPREAIALDPRGEAVGDVDGVALSPDGKTVAVTAGGTRELLLLRLPLPFLAYGGPGDHIERELLQDRQKFRRIPLGGRPLGVAFAPNGKSVVVANSLGNSLQVVDVEAGKIAREIALGGPKKPSLARRGEALFYDAKRSFNQWYSCKTCHVEGHTNGSNFDTANDGSYDTPKKTLSLRGVTQTGPWTWHGHQKSLRQLASDSLTKSMQGKAPTEAELDALMAFLETLKPLPPPNRNPDGTLKAAAQRGEAVFHAKGCQTCHVAPTYASPGVFPVGLESPSDAYPGFNPPSLRGVGTRAPYLHDGRSRTLENALTQHHRPSQLTGRPDCTPQELSDLIAFLKSL